MFTYISNSSHYKEVLSCALNAKHSLWNGTADIKDADELVSEATCVEIAQVRSEGKLKHVLG